MQSFDDYLNESSEDKYNANIGREGKALIAVGGNEVENTVVVNASKNDVTYIQKVKGGVFELNSNSNYFGSAKAVSIALDKESIKTLIAAVNKM